MEFLLRGCDVPETKERAARFPISSCIGLGLQGSQSCLCDGRLLPHHFTLTFQGRRYIFCCTSRKFTLPRRYLEPCSTKSGLSSKKISDHPTNSKAIIMIYYVCISFLYTSLLFSPVTAEISFADSDAESFVRNSFFIFELIFGAVIFLLVPSITITISPLKLI